MQRQLKTEDQFPRALRQLSQLRRFAGPLPAFWQGFLECMVGVAGAQVGVLLCRTTNGDGMHWQRAGVWSPRSAQPCGVRSFLQQVESLANTCLDQDQAIVALEGIVENGSTGFGIAVRLEAEPLAETWVAAFLVMVDSREEALERIKQLRLIAHTPGVLHLQRNAQQSQVALTQFASVLDLLALLDAESRFLAVTMTLCNELASRHKCDRVSLGWAENDYIRLQAISHTEKFERKMEAVHAIERTMEEALDQDEIITWPAPESATHVTREHAAFAESEKVKFLCSVPFRRSGQPVAVLLCERNSEPFSDLELRLLGLSTEMAARRLGELKRSDRWFGARWATAAREAAAKVVGAQHTWAKVLAAAIAVGIGVLVFGGMNYRVEAPFILRTDDIALLSAPFNGYIAEVPVEIGEPVLEKQVLLKLDTRDLLLEEAAAVAELDRFTREAEKSRATNALAEMRIALAQAEQSRVRLELIRYHLGQAVIETPFQGVIVEGDLKKRIGAPVKQGDLLFKIARTERLYIECSVNERDVHEITDTATGEIAFASQPKLKFPMRVKRLEPVAQTKEQNNVFIARCGFQLPVQPWWRPGMSGVAKLNVGKRTFFWIISHRTVDFLRMYFWL